MIFPMHWLERISPHPNILWRGPWAARFVEPARYLYDHELVVVSRGEFLLQVEDAQWVMRPGTFAIIPPNTNHVSRVVRGPVHRSCLHFDWVGGPAPRRPICSYHPRRPAANKMVKPPPFVPPGCLVGTFTDDGTVPALLDTLFFRWQTGTAIHRALCRVGLLELLLNLLWPAAGIRRPAGHASQLAYAAKELLDTQPLSDGGVQTLLAGLGCSYAHACRTFHRSFGLTPGEYLAAQRIERAKSLLRNPRLSVAEVGYQSGFNDPGYFGRKFREKTGLTPGQYRAARKH